MADDQHYDVVIIGTGAGGGTLGHRLATSGAKVLWLERGDFLPRERDNWETRRCSSAASTSRRRSGTTARPRLPARGQLLRRWQHQVLRRGPVPAATGGLRRAAPPRRHLAGLAHLATTTSSPTTPRPSTSTSCTASTARTRARAAPARSTPTRRCCHEPRIQQLSDDLEKLGLAPLPPADRGEPRRGRRRAAPARRSACIRCDRVDGFPCLLNAKSDAQVICVDPVLAQDNVTLVTGAHVQRLETDAVRPHGHRCRHHPGRRLGHHVHRRHRRGRLRRGELRGPAAAVCQRSPPRRPGQQLGRGRPALHAAQQRRPDGRLAEPNPTRFQKTLAMQRLVPGCGRLGLPAGRHPDARQVRRRADPRAGAAWAGLRSHRTCRSRCSRTTRSTSGCAARTCPDPDNRVTVDRDGSDPPEPSTRRTTSRASSGYATSSTGCSTTSACTSTTCWTAASTCTRACRSGRRPTRPAPSGSATTRRSSASTSTARPTTLDNLYVVDTSFFPSIGAVNPSLTAIANALRVGDHLAERLA